MTNSFGPWTTELSQSTGAQLSTFWKRRMARLADVNRSNGQQSFRGAVGLAVVGMAVVVVPTMRSIVVAQMPKSDPRTETSRDENSKPAATNEAAIIAKLNSPCDVDWTEVPLSNCLQFIAASKQMKIRWDDAALQNVAVRLNMPVLLRLSSAHVSEVLQLLLRPAQLDWIVQEDGLLITTRIKADEHVSERTYDVGILVRQQQISAEQIARALESTIDASDRHVANDGRSVKGEGEQVIVRQTQRVHRELELTLDKIRDAFAWRAPLDEFVTITYPVGDLVAKGLEIEQFIRKIRRRVLRSSWVEVGGSGSIREFKDTTSLVIRHHRDAHRRMVHILSTMRRLSRDEANSVFFSTDLALAPPQGDATERRTLLALLDRPVSLDVEELPLEDMAGQLNRTMGGGIFLDKSAIENGERAKSLKESITLKLRGVPLRSALKLVLDPLRLDWTIHHDQVIRIAPVEQIDATLETSVYSVTQHLSPQMSEAQLVARITANAVRETWDTAGGRGAIRALPGLLVVRQNRRGHDAVAQVLSDVSGANSK